MKMVYLKVLSHDYMYHVFCHILLMAGSQTKMTGTRRISRSLQGHDTVNNLFSMFIVPFYYNVT